MSRRLLILLAVLALAVGVLTPVAAAESPDRLADRVLPDSIADLKLDHPMTASVDAGTLDASLFAAEGSNRVVIRLVSPSVSEQKVKGKSAEKAKKNIEAEQDSLLDRVLAADPSATIIAQVQVVLNAVFVEVDASALGTLADDPAVLKITPVGNYEIDLSETVPYIGAEAVQADGLDGSGVSVAVLDSGIDYYHAGLFGTGNPNDFANDDPKIIEPGTFPTEKVVDGYDFVGSTWAGSADTEDPDPDPLDDGPGGGHGTHVGHIIGGVGGVAPGVDLYAVKVCSSVSTSCSGIALIQGMEYAADLDGDGDPIDAVDVINMSLGSPYGQPFDDDLSAAVDNASALGVLTVASAGNSSDKPYVTGSPAAAATALSVAQTNVPSAFLPQMEVIEPPAIAGLYDTVFQPWSTPLTTVIEAPLQYADGTGGNLNGCAPFTVDLTGMIVLVDRGACNFTLKIKNVGDAGGLAGIIGLVAPGDPFAGGDGGDPVTIPGYMISQADSITIKSGLLEGVTAKFDPSVGVPLIGAMVGSSSRGPQNDDNRIKPEIGAPGASISAIAGTGTGEGPFGGTSGAAPMVSGSAALLLQAAPGLSPLEAKARLMNTGEIDIDNSPPSQELAAITRIGGGEVRVNVAVGAPAAAWDDDEPAGALSFGFIDVDKKTVTLHKTVRVHNYSDETIEYSITPTFRYADDAANGAVSLSAPPKVKVKPGKDATFPVKLTINGDTLWTNWMNSGSEGASPSTLTMNEYDGYLILDDGIQPIHLAWHVLPRKASNLTGRSVLNFEDGLDVIALTNTGVGTAQNDAYSLIAVSDNQPEGERGGQSPTPDIRAVGVNTFPVRAGFCSADPSFLWAFAINSWERQSHLLPVTYWVYLDTNQDGTYDYAVINRDLSLTGSSDGRQLTWSVDLSTDSADAWFFTEHSTNTGNTVLYICGEQVGLTGTDMLATNVDVAVEAQDFYFGGPGDFVDGLTITPLGEQYFGMPEDIAGKGHGSMSIVDFGPFPGNTSELGVMLVTNGDRGPGNRGGATYDTEAMLFTVK